MAATRDDVARAAGVSPAVVSYVVNDGPRPVASGTRERVLAAIRELDYRPDGVARHLRMGRTDSLGLVLPDIGLPYFAEMTRAVSAAVAASGRQLLIATTDWDLETEHKHLSALAERRVDGIVLMSVDPAQDFDRFARPGVPLVVVDRPRFALRAATIATEHLIWHGHQRIAVIGGESRLLGSRRRTSAWESAMAAAGLDVPAGYRAEAPMTREGGYDAATALFSLEQPPTAVFIESDAQAAGLLRAAADMGLRVPDDVAIVTSEGTQVARYAVPSLSTVEQPIDVIAQDAVAAASPGSASSTGVRRIDNTQATLVVRESCGCK